MKISHILVMYHSLEIKRRSNTVRFKSIINEAFSCFIGFDPFIPPTPTPTPLDRI